jgi:hypothetical protein
MRTAASGASRRSTGAPDPRHPPPSEGVYLPACAANVKFW